MVFTILTCFIGPMIYGGFFAALILATVFLTLETLIFASVRYRICNRQLGVRFFFRWKWFPIDKISEVRKTRGILSAAALSFDRIAIRFSDKSILKSSLPLEISPEDRDGFIARLKEINPDITVKND